MKTLRIFAIVILIFVLFASELITTGLYAINDADKNEVLLEIAKSIDLRELADYDDVSDGKKDEKESSEKDEGSSDLWSVIQELKEASENGELDDVNSIDEFVNAVSNTNALRKFIMSIISSISKEQILGIKDHININALKEALVDGIAELTGLDPEKSDTLRDIVDRLTERFLRKYFAEAIEDAGGTDNFIEEIIDEDDRAIYAALTREKTRRLGVVIASVAVLLLFCLKSSYSAWAFIVGIPTAAIGGLFWIIPQMSSNVSYVLERTRFYYLANAVPHMTAPAMHYGELLAIAGAVLVFSGFIFTPKKKKK